MTPESVPNPDPAHDEVDPQPDVSSPGIWQQLSTESSFAYTAFTTFLRIGSDASLKDVAEKLGRTYAAVALLSSRHHWAERAAAWRQHVANASLGAIKQATIKNHELWALRQQILREQEWERSQQLGALCREALKSLGSNPDAKISAYELSPLLRLTSQTARTAIAGVIEAPKADSADSISDALAPFFADIEKTCDHEAKRSLPPPPTPSQPLQ